MQKKVLSLRLPPESGTPLKEFAIKESTYSKWVVQEQPGLVDEGSGAPEGREVKGALSPITHSHLRKPQFSHL